MKTSLPRLLHLIYTQNDPTAMLEITRAPVIKRFFFKDGVPVAATSNVLGEVLGRLLLAEGVITQKDYESSLELVLKEKKRHGEVLIAEGLITAVELDAFLALQLQKRVWKLFSWNEGEYSYTTEATVPSNAPSHHLNTPRLILDGISLGHYPLVWLKKDLSVFLDKKLISSAPAGRYTLADFGLTIQETRFFNSFDGNKSLEEVLAMSDLLSHRALALAITFIIARLIRVEGVQTAAPKPVQKPKPQPTKETGTITPDARVNAEILFMKAKTAVISNNFKEAHELLTEIFALNPQEAEYRAYMGWTLFNMAASGPSVADKAEKLIKEALETNNELGEAWFFLGAVLLKNNRFDEAIKAFSAALAKDPWMLRATASLKCAEIEKAEVTKNTPAEQIAVNEYIEFFGLSNDPFSSAATENIVSLSVEQKLRFDQMLTCFNDKPGPILLQGRDGIGKTTLILELLRRLSGKKLQAAILLKPPLKEIDFIKAVNAELARSAGAQGAKIFTRGDKDAVNTAGAGADTTAIKTEIEKLGVLLEQITLKEASALLIIDHAHQMTTPCLKLLTNISKLKGLRLLYAGDSGFALKLKDHAFRELDHALTSRFSLQKAFSKNETKAYIMKRLVSVTQASCPVGKELSFTDDAVTAVCQKSYGIPGLINKLCSQMLAKAAEKKIFVIDKDLV
ncbi:tetratricopeptide repeat protein [bacterium]|nr:MAG: tetratricopeptide repeat protein [bacterium]